MVQFSGTKRVKKIKRSDPLIYTQNVRQTCGLCIVIFVLTGMLLFLFLMFNMSLCYCLERVVHQISFIYGGVNYIICRFLWSSLIDFPKEPWLLVGDFNPILGAHEATGNIASLSCDEFQAMITVCDEFQVDTQVCGSQYMHISTFVTAKDP